jgi:site-specific recombinase XerD
VGLEDYSTELNRLVDVFFAHLKRRNKAEKTIKRWRPELRRFVAWVGERPLSEITAARLDNEFLAVWEADFRERNGRDPAPNSLRAVIQAVVSFYRFLERFDYLVDAERKPFRNPASALEAPVIRPLAELDWLRAEEDQALLACPMNAREQILVCLLRMTGLRLNEALTLTNRDVDLGANQVTVRNSKTEAGFRVVPISPELRLHVEHWQTFVRSQGLYRPDGPFLVTRNHTPMKAQYVQTALQRVGERAGLARKLKPHTLRRTFGSHLLNRGVRLEVVSKLLGHASTAITESAYARLEDKTIRDEFLEAFAA